MKLKRRARGHDGLSRNGDGCLLACVAIGLGDDSVCGERRMPSYTRTAVAWWWWWCDSFRLPLIYTAVSVSAAAAAVDKTIPRAFATSSAHAWSMNACNTAILYLVRIIPTYQPIY